MLRFLPLALLLLLLCPPGPVVCAREESTPAPTFVNVAKKLGVAGHPGARCAFADLDGDGWPDLVINRQIVLRNVGGWSFKDVTEASGINVDDGREKPRIADLLTFGDVDNDGDLDIFSGRSCDFEKEGVTDDGRRSEILLNDGKGRFTVKKDSGVRDHPATTCAATFLDYDRDGKLDLFVANWYRQYGKGLECYPPRLYRGRGDGSFEDVSEKAGLLGVAEPARRDSRRPIYGVTHADWNNDGWPDLLVCAYGRQWNLLFTNDGDGTFTDVGAETGFDGDADRTGTYPDWAQEFFVKRLGRKRGNEAPFRSNGNTFSCAPADFDNDGDMDCVLGEITHNWAGSSSDLTSVLVNMGKEKGWAFERRVNAGAPRPHALSRGWNQGDMHVAWLDYDLDGLLDLIISSSDYPDDQRMRLYRQGEDHAFTEVTKDTGLDWVASNAISIADFDRDGDPDILAGRSLSRLSKEQRAALPNEVALWQNDQRTGHHWIAITLRGKGRFGANRSAIGARVFVHAGGRTQMREVTGSTGHVGDRNSFALLFGIGEAKTIERIEILWPGPNRTPQVIEKARIDAYLEVEEK
jgi:enediyne biosynthesis protein E4